MNASNTTKRRCLEIVTRSDWAGAQKVVYTITRGIKEKYGNEMDIEVACGNGTGVLISELEKIGVRVHVVPDLIRELSLGRDLRTYFQIKKIIKEGQFDVVHLHSSKVRILGGMAARKLKVKDIVYTVHGWWHIEQYTGLKRNIFILAERIGARYSDKLVFLCKRDMQKAKNWKIGKETQYAIIPNAIIPESAIKKGSLRRELGIKDDVKIVGNMARLDPPKNPVRFLETAKIVLNRMSNVVFVWIGGSTVEDKLGNQVEEWLEKNSQIADKFYFLPFRKDATELMADFDVFLLTSDSEGMPLVILEAVEHGVPVVSTDVGCVEEMIGIVAKSDEELVEMLSRTLHDQNREFHVNWTYDDFVSAYYKIYKASNKGVAKDS